MSQRSKIHEGVGVGWGGGEQREDQRLRRTRGDPPQFKFRQTL